MHQCAIGKQTSNHAGIVHWYFHSGNLAASTMPSHVCYTLSMKQEYEEDLILAVREEKVIKKHLSWLSERKAMTPVIVRKIHALHDEIFEIVDCKECGHCCRSLGPRVKNPDIDKLAKALGTKKNQFAQDYLKVDEDEQFVFKTMPCPFLEQDNLCAVYHDRPRSCSDYPHTADRDIGKRLYRLAADTQYCPAAYRIVKALITAFPM